MPRTHEALFELQHRVNGVMTHICSPALRRQRQEGQKFRVITDYIVNLNLEYMRPARIERGGEKRKKGGGKCQGRT